MTLTTKKTYKVKKLTIHNMYKLTGISPMLLIQIINTQEFKSQLKKVLLNLKDV